MFAVGTIPNQQPNESLILFLRSDRFILFKIILRYAFFSCVPPAFVALLRLFSFRTTDDIQILLELIFIMYYLFLWAFLYHAFLDYYLDIWMVTTDRIVSIEQKGLFYRSVAELNIYRIQDVRFEIKGIFATLFNYGNVDVQTAGSAHHFTFKEVARPEAVAQKINEVIDWRRSLGRERGLGQPGVLDPSDPAP